MLSVSIFSTFSGNFFSEEDFKTVLATFCYHFLAVLMYSLYHHPRNFNFKQKYQQYGLCFQAIFPFFMTMVFLILGYAITRTWLNEIYPPLGFRIWLIWLIAFMRNYSSCTDNQWIWTRLSIANKTYSKVLDTHLQPS